jgi:membrane protease YdiL (CAAX protease family)
MIGIIVELLISWLLLKYIEHQNLSVLGLSPTPSHLKQLGSGLLLSGLFLMLFSVGVSLAVKNPYHLNPNYSVKAFCVATAYVFRAVLYEDLIFRGALLYILIKRLGATKAVLISAVCFGIYHWFSWGAFGNPVQMAIIFAITGMGGYVFALAFKKTQSMYLPFALHFGCDFVSMVILSQDKAIGLQLLVKTFAKDLVSPGSFVSLIVILLHFIGFPLVTFCYLQLRYKTRASCKT